MIEGPQMQSYGAVFKSTNALANVIVNIIRFSDPFGLQMHLHFFDI